MKQFLFDMDGVLFDWVEGFESIYGDPISKNLDEMKLLKEEISKTDFYLNLKPIQEGFELFEYCKTIGKVGILTSVGKFNSDEVAEQKRNALINALGYLPEFFYTKSSAEKANYVGKDVVLIDDRVKAVNPFKLAGGTAILFTSKEQAITEIKKLSR